MTRKDFEFIANFLKDYKPELLEEPHSKEVFKSSHGKYWDHMVKGMAERLQETNPRFNKERFIKACGYEEFA